MQTRQDMPDHAAQEHWLTTYYYARAAFAIAWVIAALGLPRLLPAAAAVLLVLYPAWDALANQLDAARSGGLGRNRTQALNFVVSLLVAVAVAAALPDMHRVLGVFGAWAILSGLLQLGTGLRRWKAYGAQWAMILSGAQSALAGATFIFQARAPQVPSVATLAGYAGFGAFYFLVAALTLSVRARRRRRA
jgi:uncharacterized membrane protein HdeD (DUF308 family)